MAFPCVVLAGGLGTRMHRQAGGIPKALIPVHGRPFADLQLERLSAAGVKDVIYCVGHLGALIRDHVADGRRFGLHVDYVDEGDDLRGTAGALRLAHDQGMLADAFHVLYGDSYLVIDFAAVERSWRAADEPAQMVVLRNDDRWDRSNVVMGDSLVRVYEPDASRKHAGMHWIDYGLSTLDRGIVAEMIPADAVVQLPSLWAALSAAGRVRAFEVEERFFEVGSPAGLRDLEEHLAARS